MGKKAKRAKKEYRAALARTGSQLLTQAERFKYSDAEARDASGRWSSDGGGDDHGGGPADLNLPAGYNAEHHYDNVDVYHDDPGSNEGHFVGYLSREGEIAHPSYGAHPDRSWPLPRTFPTKEGARDWLVSQHEAEHAKKIDKGNDIQTALHGHSGGGGANPERDLQREQHNAGRVHGEQSREVAHDEQERAHEERDARRLDQQLRRNHERAVRERLRREREAKARAAARRAKGRGKGKAKGRGKGKGRKGGKGKTLALPTFLQHESRETIHELTHGDYDRARVPAGSSTGGQFTSSKGA